MGDDGVVVDAVAWLQDMGLLAVNDLHPAGVDHDELFAFVSGEVFVLGRLGQDLDEEGLHVPVVLALAQGIKAQGDRMVLAPKHVQLLFPLLQADDKGIPADLVVQKGAQAQTQGPGDL